ncbi:nuclear transport factor 2 family protein [Streptomyces hainanensis]|uniref:Nuclear transport factor 2 family protein n=1 Tax=Streptomyces hainanensis TaxID=402648 RepID=A0A4V2Y3J0_9ACTN|nr:nuclear transport factor 2 family protein [Streptomyces hainanensis]TDC76725.1 nuclear transport factor 2 family protein [Streptomyces hainanensis]
MNAPHERDDAPLAAADAYFDAWRTNRPDDLADVLAPDVRVNGPLGRIDGADRYRAALARIFDLTDRLDLRRRWVEGDDVMTWFDLHPRGGDEPFPVASWLHVENGRVARVDVTFDVGRLLRAGDPRYSTDED